MRKKISVVVPVYNVERYIERCIKSLQNQTYKNMEIILVEDGTPDKSGEICDKFANDDNRIKVVHKVNGGLSSARNAGLDVSTGDYIGFVDSDDWVEPTMYESLVTFLEENECDLVECAVNLYTKNVLKKYESQCPLFYSGEEALEIHLNTKQFNYMPRVAVWSKLFKSEFWENRRFPEGHVHEDYMLTCEALFTSKKVGLLREGMYNHLTDNNTSIMNSSFGKKDLFLENQYMERIEYLKSNKAETLRKLAEKEYFLLMMSLYWRCNISNMSEQERYLSFLKNNYQTIRRYDIPWERKIELYFIVNMNNIYNYMRRLLISRRKFI